MKKKFFIALSLTSIFCWADSLPINLDSLEYDNLDTDISDLKYEVQEENVDDLSNSSEEKTQNEKDKSDSKPKLNISGYKKKNSDSKDVKIKFDIEDLKKFLKEAGLHDAGSYDDGAIYDIAKSLAASGVGISGNEQRKYKKGMKTKGFHRVSHKDEYNKNKEFYEDDETSGVIKKIGGKGIGFKIDSGAGIKKGYFHHDHNKGLFGKEALSNKGTSNKEYEGSNNSEGFDAFFKIK